MCVIDGGEFGRCVVLLIDIQIISPWRMLSLEVEAKKPLSPEDLCDSKLFWHKSVLERDVQRFCETSHCLNSTGCNADNYQVLHLCVRLLHIVFLLSAVDRWRTSRQIESYPLLFISFGALCPLKMIIWLVKWITDAFEFSKQHWSSNIKFMSAVEVCFFNQISIEWHFR